MQLFKRHDQNGDGLLDAREMASVRLAQNAYTHSVDLKAQTGG
jgi:hypothetical protein